MYWNEIFPEPIFVFLSIHTCSGGFVVPGQMTLAGTRSRDFVVPSQKTPAMTCSQVFIVPGKMTRAGNRGIPY